jgi:hypothetical protein
MNANHLVVLLLFLLLGTTAAQQPTVRTPTNVVIAATSTNPVVVVQPNELPKNFHDNAITQNFWPEDLKQWIGIFQGVSVIVASVVAWLGITAWRREFVGKRRIELAEEVLALFYQAEEIIAWMRSPWTLSFESSKRKSESIETPEQKEINDAIYVFSKRFDSELFSRIRAIRFRFMALFGKDASAPFNELKSVLDELQIALSSWAILSSIDTSRYNPEELKRHEADIEKREKVLWSSEKDQISLRIENAVKSIDLTCRPHIDPKAKSDRVGITYEKIETK